MRIALSAGELDQDEPVSHAVLLAASIGADGVELWYPANTGPRVDDALALTQAHGLAVPCLATATQLASPNRWEQDLRTLTTAVNLAADHGIPLVNTYFGYPVERDDTAGIECYRQRLEPALDAAARRGVVITLENEFDCFGVDRCRSEVTRRPAALRHLAETIDSPHFGLTFDPCNAFFAGNDPLAFLRETAEYVRYVHVKDGRATGDAAAPSGWRLLTDSGVHYTTCDLGVGELDWPVLLDELAGLGYDGWFNLEPHADATTRDRAWGRAQEYLRGRRTAAFEGRTG